MAGIYLHIPFCKQACHYCDFHFSTTLRKKGELVQALCCELLLRKNETREKIETIYFGGGTPSLLSVEELELIFTTIFENFTVSPSAEITLEANPDDLSETKISQLAQTKINRLSIGVQSFFDHDLKWMNRSHNAEEALTSIALAKKHFDNLSIDLIYGVPGMENLRWQQNLQKALDFDIPHISSYALTVGPNTVLKKHIDSGKTKPVDDGLAREHYETLVEMLQHAGYVNYEFSNFGKPGYFSKNNTAYWMGKSYLGIGPSAHGFDGENRFWNVRNNSLYIKSIAAQKLPQEMEALSVTDRYNEYVMTRLRTIWGISTAEIRAEFGENYAHYFEKESIPFFEQGLLENEGGKISISKKGKFLSDGIAADLFYVG